MDTPWDEVVAAVRTLAATDGIHGTGIPEVQVSRFSRRDRLDVRPWNASLILVAQGTKELALGPTRHLVEPGGYAMTPVGLTVSSRTASATLGVPFLGLVIDVNPGVLVALAAEVPSGPEEAVTDAGEIFVGSIDDCLLGAVVRLVRLLGRPEDARVLGPMVIREIFYYLLRGSEGAVLRHVLQLGTKAYRIARAQRMIRQALAERLDIPKLAGTSYLSRSAFFAAFREVTGVSPVQYQKNLRLTEARRLMVQEDLTAKNAAYQVGYASASQFSREYARHFGASPRRDRME